MPTITGIDREQITFSSLETQIANDNEILFIDTFVDKLDLEQLGIQSLVQTQMKKEGRDS
jgi:hypothetical protein